MNTLNGGEPGKGVEPGLDMLETPNSCPEAMSPPPDRRARFAATRATALHSQSNLLRRRRKHKSGISPKYYSEARAAPKKLMQFKA
ncbi:hypothetical protein GCM10011611_27460 [Aliidongia dinghuensis]|uniref:Uncharacterized protein n=1 Tax=Aliidongia dinghuensis TaxID=1867774 RepID=A0A8J3E583_9PROT|nr:hypothetical protein GCM10011611_27460 [Aliidongia dinghuensis]